MARVREEGMEDRILDSAFAVFGERGFQATTLKDIAKGAGISSGSIYTYFPDKESLFKAAVNRGWASFIEELETINRSIATRDERIALLLDRSFTTLRSILPLIRGMLFESSRQNLVAPNVEKLCASIVELLKPDEGDPLREAWGKNVKFSQINRIVVLGVLSSAALLPASSAAETVLRLKEAISALLVATGLIIGSQGEDASRLGASR